MSSISSDEARVQQQILDAFESRRFEDAVQLLEPLAFSRDDPELLNNLGALYFQLGWQLEAECAFKKALAIEPRFVNAATNLAELYIDLGLPFSAMRELRNIGIQGAAEEDWQPLLRALQARFPTQRVSVYTPGYNSEAWIERCLNSILNQSYPPYELIVVDDKSPDRSTEIALRYGVTVHYHSENLGLAASCNTALKHCRGEFLAKIDTDLELDPTWLERAVMAFRSATTAGVGGRLYEFRTTTIADQWRQVCMKQHWGPVQVINPEGLFGADCIFRVSALRAVQGWNPTYRTNYEDFDLSNRLKAAGFELIYEPLAAARHLRQDSLTDVIRNCWNWQHPIPQDHGCYDSLEKTVTVLENHVAAGLNTLTGLLQLQRPELLYPSFLLYYWWAVRDVQHVLRRKHISPKVASETALGIYLAAQRNLRGNYLIPARVVERTLLDLRTFVSSLAIADDKTLVNSDAAMESVIPANVLEYDQIVDAISAALPEANIPFISAFLQHTFLNRLGPGIGSLIELSVRAIEAEDLANLQSYTTPAFVLYNPPAGRAHFTPGLQDRAGGLRWRAPSRMCQLAGVLRSLGARVLLLDAVELHLGQREAQDRLLGLEPNAVIYDASQGGLDRIVMSARQLKLAGPRTLRQILVGVSAKQVESARERFPMFDEVQTEWQPMQRTSENKHEDDLLTRPLFQGRTDPVNVSGNGYYT